MKKFKEYTIGDEVELLVRLSDVQIRRNASNNLYASLVAYDGEEMVDTKIWALDDQKQEVLKNGQVYIIKGRLKDYQGKLQLTISDLREVTEEDEVDLDLFYESAPLPKKEIQENIANYVQKIENPILKDIVLNLMKKYFEPFFEYPAAVTMHHNYISGLSYHVYSMLKLAEAYVTLYPFLNKDLLYAGVILHDLGKVIELSGAKGTEYTKAGNLIGHISLATNEIAIIANELGTTDSDEVITLMHLILSHHGQLEYGSPKEPQMAEAVLLHIIDNSDSRLAALEKELKNIPAGEFTIPLFMFDRKAFYLPKFKK